MSKVYHQCINYRPDVTLILYTENILELREIILKFREINFRLREKKIELCEINLES